jgi:hypothetical protein
MSSAWRLQSPRGRLQALFPVLLMARPVGFSCALSTRLSSIVKMDALGYEPMAFRMRRQRGLVDSPPLSARRHAGAEWRSG